MSLEEQLPNVITRDTVVAAILVEDAEGGRWAEVDIEGVRSVQLGAA